MRNINGNEIGSRITHVRGHESQAQFAKRLGVHKNTVGNYERGDRTPDAVFLKALMRLGVDIRWVLTGEGEPWATADETSNEMMLAVTGDPEAQAAREKRLNALMERMRVSTRFLQDVKRELDIPPQPGWDDLLQQLLVQEHLTEEGAYAILQRLKAMNGDD